MAKTSKTTYDKIIEICLKRAIIYPNSEIYGGFSGFYDYGSIGHRIKRNWENYWRNYFLNLEENFHEIETTNMMPEAVFEASGHLKEFVDPIAECKKCGMVERADHILEKHLKQTFEGLPSKEFDELIKKHKIKCHACGGELKEVDVVGLMFDVNVGPYTGGTKGYLRPETAQGAYIAFKREYNANREKLPLGLAIVGKAYRNEVSPRQGVFRVREFDQAELQIFFDPSDLKKHPKFNEVKDFEMNVVLVKHRKKGIQKMTCEKLVKQGLPKFYVYYMAKIQQFYDLLGVPAKKIRWYEKSPEERAHYNKIHFDVEIFFESYGGFKEVDGLHYRTDYDLSKHQKLSNRNLEVTKGRKKFIPHVVELSFGVDRNVFALLDLDFKEDKKRTYFSLPSKIAPYIAGVYPLVSKDKLDEKAREVFKTLKGFEIWYDESGSIGRRYARADEIGIPFGITIDYDTIKDDTVTIRERDTTKQKRIKIIEICDELYKHLYV